MVGNGSDYLKQNKVDERLAKVLVDLGREKPVDPYKFLAEKLKALPAPAPASAAKLVAASAAKPDDKAAVKKGGKNDSKPKPKAKPEAKKAAASKPSKGGGMDVKKADDVPEWYAQVIKKAELIEDYPVKGCFTLRPWAYRMWEIIMGFFDGEIKKLGVENGYFPMFIPKEYIGKEEDHLEDFAAELAWVGKFGNAELDEPVALRPTSETAMYAAYANWVQSYRDLPIKINQWCNGFVGR